ncbi:MBL fold metallo-hydrolase [Oscillospiraceae bacterium CM]|nr:MBL fold metallo-hydrolase [Oscillospiraceae bacterium CM]
MTVCTLASSSSGNCTLVSHGGVHVLIDIGISLRRITAALKQLGLTPGDLSGVLLTHEHADHISGLGMLVKHHQTRFYASNGVAQALCEIVPGASSCLVPFIAGTEFSLGDLLVTSFVTPHDTPESVGYRIDSGRSTLAFVTDIGCVTQPILNAVLGADVAVIEANHDVNMLKNGAYPPYLKRRILSERGHLSNADSGLFAQRLAKSGTRKLILAHLSRENNTPHLALETVGTALMAAGASVGGDVLLEAAPADQPGRIYIV